MIARSQDGDSGFRAISTPSSHTSIPWSCRGSNCACEGLELADMTVRGWDTHSTKVSNLVKSRVRFHVHEGLESALNIDRASFRETDPHYLALRAVLWKNLKERVFPEFKSRQKSFSAQRTATENQGTGRPSARRTHGCPPNPLVLSRRLQNSTNRMLFTLTGGARSQSLTADSRKFFASSMERLFLTELSFDRVAKELSLAQPAERPSEPVSSLAAYGVWDCLKPDEAETLLRALAIAAEA